ncbi:MAG: hypothetical protein HY265_08895, partial [Deltaproteobacteria bacterium]|nr:hypothetical protein [Deltaproteobacteria bacterium]
MTVISYQLETAMSKSSNEVKDGYFFYSLLIAFFLFTVHCSLFTVSFAADTPKTKGEVIKKEKRLES